ncbi:MAG: hypothetical protein U9N42_07715 [Campylobacterota bacterium]|nr:hypothetical protein [Campylobacterota bacterium]
MNEKRKLSQIKEIEFKCKKCNTKMIFEIDKKSTMLERCCNCGDAFRYDNIHDPMAHLTIAIEKFQKINNLEISLICESD